MLAELSMFLASDGARNIYGQEIVADGGDTIRRASSRLPGPRRGSRWPERFDRLEARG